MYQPHPIFITGKSITEPIWRYMSFTKFLSLIHTRQLFFSSISELQKSDPFEGTLALINQTQEYRRFAMSELYKHLDADRAEELIETFYTSGDRFRSQMAHFSVVNCWHINKYESAAMWKLYLSGGEGLAIRSSLERLKGCFIEDSKTPITAEGTRVPIHIGEVQYIDHRRDVMPEDNTYYPFIYKYKAFEHERELRAMSVIFPMAFGFESLDFVESERELPEILQRLKRSKGLGYPIDIEILVEEIVLAPNSPTWISELTHSVVAQAGLKLPIRASDLL